MDQLLSSQPMEDLAVDRGGGRSAGRRTGHNDLNLGGDELVAQTGHSLGKARLIRLRAVQERVGLGRTAVYKLIKDGQFPRPVKVGAASAWIDIEITRWIEQLAESRGTTD
jgi:prophage regulatory protein